MLNVAGASNIMDNVAPMHLTYGDARKLIREALLLSAIDYVKCRDGYAGTDEGRYF